MAVDGVCALDVVDFPPLQSTTTPEKHRRSFSLLSSPLMIVGLSRKNVLYRQLPHQPLMLSVLKLDGSSFDIQVRRSATVAELKGAVELVFSHMPQHGPGKISWLHVWWHFCLCYAGQKLVDDADYIASFGIKDGDQLQFVRHVTTGYNVIRKQSKKLVVSSKLISRISSRSKSFKQNDQKDMERYNYNDIESGRCQHSGSNNNDLFMNHEPKMVVFLGGWFSHTKLASAGKMSIKSLVRPSVTRPSLTDITLIYIVILSFYLSFSIPHFHLCLCFLELVFDGSLLLLLAFSLLKSVQSQIIIRMSYLSVLFFVQSVDVVNSAL